MTLFAMLTLAVAVGPIAWLARARIAGLRQWLVASTAAAAMSGAALLGRRTHSTSPGTTCCYAAERSGFVWRTCVSEAWP